MILAPAGDCTTTFAGWRCCSSTLGKGAGCAIGASTYGHCYRCGGAGFPVNIRPMTALTSTDADTHIERLPRGSFREIMVSGNGMLPLYRHGDQLLVRCTESARCGDRVIVESEEFGLVAGTLIHFGKDQVVVAQGGQPSKSRRVDLARAKYFGRVVWASQ